VWTCVQRSWSFPSATAKHYRNLCVNFRRLLAEDEIKQAPAVAPGQIRQGRAWRQPPRWFGPVNP
jgi:hypothetical protein